MRKEHVTCFWKLFLYWYLWKSHGERSPRCISEECKQDARQPPHWAYCPTQALHVHRQAREETKAFFSKNLRLYLLSLAYPDHPRFKAGGRQAQQVQVLEDGCLYDNAATETIHEVTLVIEHAATNKRAYF